MEKFRGKYRISSARWQNWDYRWVSAYFITICTKNRKCFFGEISNSIMKLSDVGILADIFWNEIKNHTKNIELGEYVVMPNHVHGILVLNGEIPDSVADTSTDSGVDMGHIVKTGHALFLLPPPSSFPPPPKHKPTRFRNQPSDNNVFKILEKIRCRRLLVHTNRRLQNTRTVWVSK